MEQSVHLATCKPVCLKICSFCLWKYQKLIFEIFGRCPATKMSSKCKKKKEKIKIGLQTEILSSWKWKVDPPIIVHGFGRYLTRISTQSINKKKRQSQNFLKWHSKCAPRVSNTKFPALFLRLENQLVFLGFSTMSYSKATI